MRKLAFNIWTPETLDRLQQLRSAGLSMDKIALEIGCSATTVFNALHAEKWPQKEQQLKSTLAPNLPPHVLNSSCPLHVNRPISHEQRSLKQTKSELYRMLATAVRNTIAASHR
jgi:lambda repressor-like predicted transcriptional regulator